MQTATTYTLKGQEVFGPSHSLGNVDYLRNDELGREIVNWINRQFSTNPNMRVDLARYKERQPIQKGSIIYEGTVSKALDELGVRDVHTATPEEVMGVLRLKEFEDARRTLNSFGVVIITRKGYYQTLAERLMAQAGVTDDMLPAAFFQLRSTSDEKIPLDYTESSIWYPAPALKVTEFKTTRNQTLADLLTSGQERTGDLQVTTFGEGLYELIRDSNLSALFFKVDDFKYSRVLLGQYPKKSH